MVRFVRAHDIWPILSRNLTEAETDSEVRQKLLPLAEISSIIPINLPWLNRELAFSLGLLNLYDLAILIGRNIAPTM